MCIVEEDGWLEMSGEKCPNLGCQLKGVGRVLHHRHCQEMAECEGFLE
jgi:hypothetical protein